MNPVAPEAIIRGFVVHAWADVGQNRILMAGRLADGRSFAAVDDGWQPSLLLHAVAIGAASRVLVRSGLQPEQYTIEYAVLAAFEDGAAVHRIRFGTFRDRLRAVTALTEAGIASPDADMRPADAYLLEKGIRGPVLIVGQSRPGRSVDLVFSLSDLRPGDPTFRAALRIASIDIETDEVTRGITAVALSLVCPGQAVTGTVRVLVSPDWSVPAAPRQPDRAASRTATQEKAMLLPAYPGVQLFIHHDEATMLQAFADDLRRFDPDALTGWNVLDFDLPRLAERFAVLRLPLAIGRSLENARFMPGEGRRSAAAFIPGRQVIDALRAVRAGPEKYADYTLETVAQAVLGEGKSVAGQGADKLAALERLRAAHPVQFAAYCYRDALLVNRILERTGLFHLATERAALTGVSLDKAWTSVASFERIYAMELRDRSLAQPLPAGNRRLSGAPGGTVLEPLTGLFSNVAVFDFRSLYPSIIRTFNIDPLAHARAGHDNEIIAPNGAAFSRVPGILPALIDTYFASRKVALDDGDVTAAYVYKILMNSFYGVLGSGACRYALSELAGAITSFARQWLHATRDWFGEQGLRVLYGDTDSLFVSVGLDDGSDHAIFSRHCGALADEINAWLSGTVRSKYGVESRLELRFEKAYRRFMIQALRTDGSKGRAKGYAGYLLLPDGTTQVEIKGMEAVRSDATPLARRLQLELMKLVFSDSAERAFTDHLQGTVRRLLAGELDAELVCRKRLTRPPEAYTAATPPQVKAARALGWTGRRGMVEYVWTRSGAEPAAAALAPLDYQHYIRTQVLPIASGIATAAGWIAPSLPGIGHEGYRQLEMDLG
jgi:DNA polymerase-2